MDEARRHETHGDWLAAYGYARVARYPSLTSAPKREAYARSRDLYLRATAGAHPPIERVAIPFAGRIGEGSAVPAYLRRPAGSDRPPIVLTWGGIDAFKEERRADAYLAEGWATLAMDMPGTGEAPLAGSTDAERLWDPVFAWVAARADLDARRVAIVGGSTGGYWAAKLAHTHRERIAGAVDHGGPIHHAFTAPWIARAEAGEYPFEYCESLAQAFGMSGADEWRRRAPQLSLLTLGVLDRPCAPLLLLHGESDTVFPIADLHLVLARGGHRWWRVFPGGHMGRGDTTGAITAWLRERFAAAQLSPS